MILKWIYEDKKRMGGERDLPASNTEVIRLAKYQVVVHARVRERFESDSVFAAYAFTLPVGRVA